MKKQFWVDLRDFDETLLIASLEAGADAVLLPSGRSDDAKRLGRITTISDSGDLQLGRDVEIITIAEKGDEDKIVALGGKIPVIIENLDWTIIPLENLISRTSNLIQSVRGPEDAKLALEVMERGADGILLRPDSVTDIARTAQVVKEMSSERFLLTSAKVTTIKPTSIGDRCSVDTTSILPPGTGMLVGNYSSALFLVHNENVHGLYCAARPFRVNAGAVHAYIRLPENRTKYLCELTAGDDVLAVDPRGNAHAVTIGRNKIEKRPMLLVIAESQEGRRVSLVLQNAETIRLTTPDGKPAPVTELKTGDNVLAYFEDPMGRHFGEPVTESIKEE